MCTLELALAGLGTGAVVKEVSDRQAKKTEQAYQQQLAETQQKATAERAEFEEKLSEQSKAPSPLRLRTRKAGRPTGLGMLRIPRTRPTGMAGGSGAGLGMGGGAGTGLNV